MQYIGIIASIVCAFYAFKTFKQAEKIAKIQDQKEKDKEANMQLNEIIRCFFIDYYNFCVGSFIEKSLLDEYRKDRKLTKEEEFEKYRKCSCPDKNKRINYLINE